MTEHGEYRVDRTGWESGPWDREPDRVEFRHCGLPCLLVRSELMGMWCGYAGVSPGHPYYGERYSDVDAHIHVHGGLTYADKCFRHICHTPAPGEPDDVFWFGFDCGHGGDIKPGFDARERALAALAPEMAKLLEMRQRLRQAGEEVYRDMAYAKRETEELAEQLAAVGGAR